MNEKIISAQLKENIERVQLMLNEFSVRTVNSAHETELMLVTIEKLYRALAVNKFLVESKELSNDLNVHLKIMDTVSKQEEAKIEVNPSPSNSTLIEEPKKKETPIINYIIEPLESNVKEIKEEEKILAPIILTKEEAKVESETKSITSKKLEIGINDKFRMINELFGQNNVEYATAINQLNLCNSLEESEDYLDSLKLLYEWKADLVIVKTLYLINHKRFS